MIWPAVCYRDTHRARTLRDERLGPATPGSGHGHLEHDFRDSPKLARPRQWGPASWTCPWARAKLDPSGHRGRLFPYGPNPRGTRTSSRISASQSPPNSLGASNLPTAEGAEAAAPRSLVPPEEAGADIHQSERKELGRSSAETHLLGRTAPSALAREQDRGP